MNKEDTPTMNARTSRRMRKMLAARQCPVCLDTVEDGDKDQWFTRSRPEILVHRGCGARVQLLEDVYGALDRGYDHRGHVRLGPVVAMLRRLNRDPFCTTLDIIGAIHRSYELTQRLQKEMDMRIETAMQVEAVTKATGLGGCD